VLPLHGNAIGCRTSEAASGWTEASLLPTVASKSLHGADAVEARGNTGHG
jgi:hypothetical protein